MPEASRARQERDSLRSRSKEGEWDESVRDPMGVIQGLDLYRVGCLLGILVPDRDYVSVPQRDFRG